MAEPTIICPNCKTEIKLTESLAAPLIDSTRREYEKRLAQKDADVAKRDAALREREETLSRAQQTIDEEVTEKLKLERGKIAVEEAKKAKLFLQTDIDQKTQALADLQEVINQQNTKLTEAQKAQADLLRKHGLLLVWWTPPYVNSACISNSMGLRYPSVECLRRGL